MNDNELFENEGFEITNKPKIHRRDFLRCFGSGIVILISTGGFSLLKGTQQAISRGRNEYPADFNAYLKIGKDGRIACYSGKIEMGQGIITSLAQMLAEEMNVQLDIVDMVMGDTALCPYDSSTTGSRSTKYFGPALRRAAAEAKSVLLQLAAEQWNVSGKRLYAKDGEIIDKKPPHRKISYGQIAMGKTIARHIKGPVPLKHYSNHHISGQATLRTDSLTKVTGEAKFAGDIRLPGMLYACVLRPPSHGSILRRVDVTAAQKVDGIKVIEEGELFAVLHEYRDQAEIAAGLLKAEWEEAKTHVDNSNIFEYLEKSAPPGRIVTQKGELDKGIKLSTQSFESTYTNHYVAHAPIETYTVTVQAGRGEATAWASTQAPFRVRTTIADTLKIPEENVRVYTPFVGGGFGGKKSGQQVIEAAILSKLSGRPVQLAWTRKEEFFYDAFRPAAVIKAKSGLAKSGKIVYWDFKILFAGTRSSEPIYNIPHHRILYSGTQRGSSQTHLFNVGAWRGPGSNTNVFAMESQADIMAQAAGMDPVSFRMKNLSDQRMKRVLKAAADKFGHYFFKAPSGKGYGIACTNYLNTYVATIAELKINKKTGEVKVKRMVCAQDMGEIINPQGAKIQIEGGLTMGLGYALTEKVMFKGGKILDDNFDTYEIPRFSWAPQIEVVLIDNPELAPQGCGEPAITTTGAVIANAVYDAIGIRFFELPMTPEIIKNALSKS